MGAQLIHLFLDIFIDYQRLAGADDVIGYAAERHWFVIHALSFLHNVRIVSHPCRVVIPANGHALRVEDIADRIANQVNDGAEVEFCRQSLLHVVNDGKFRGALLGLFEQALGFIEEARVFERDAHGVGNRCSKPYHRLGKNFLVFHIHKMD